MSAPPPLTDEQKNLVKQFVDVTGASEKQAEFFLDAASYDVQRATSTYFETTGGSSASGGAGNIRTLGGIKKQPMVDPKKEKQRQYTGGASSGMMVEDTPDDDDEEEEGEGDNMPMDEKSIVDQILAKAKKASEEAIRENEEQRANQQKKKYFTGAGRKLGAEDNAAVPESSSNTGSQPQSPELENVERHMTFWRNGFTIEDGPLLRYDDPANQTLLNAIQSGRAPMELFKVKYGQRAEVKVSQRRDEDYVPPAKKIVAFEGEGRRLGSHVPSYTAPPSVSSSAQPRPNLVIDESVPTTSIQIRLADGTRMVAKFNVTHKLSDIIQFIKASRSDQRAFILQTQFPVKPLTDENSTIETLGLKNAVIIQKYTKKIISGRKSKSASKPLYLCSPFVDNSLVTGSFKNVTQLPAHMSDFKEEWIAVNTFDFFTHLNALYGSISEFCTPTTCPVMNGLNNTEFQWIDSNKKSSRVSAPQYIDFMFTQIQNIIEDESVFPTKQGMDFPKDFDVVVKQIFKHYFRLFAHVYFAHYDKILHLEMEGHWNTLVSHVVSFAKEFDLVQDKKELSHMQELMDALRIE